MGVIFTFVSVIFFTCLIIGGILNKLQSIWNKKHPDKQIDWKRWLENNI